MIPETILEGAEPLSAVEQAHLAGYRKALAELREVQEQWRRERQRLAQARAQAETHAWTCPCCQDVFDAGWAGGQEELRRGGWTEEEERAAQHRRFAMLWGALAAGLAAICGGIGYFIGRGWL
jgi:hypothetical protein